MTAAPEPEPGPSQTNDDAQAIELSVVMPAYNEADRIGPTVREYLDHFKPLYGEAFEIIAVMNGCTDATREVIEQAAAGSPQMRILEFAEPLGKGGAIWEGLAVARGRKAAFVDADNMVRAPEAEKLIRALDTHEVAIADRFSGFSESGGQPALRRAIGIASRLWVRLFLGLPYSDTQCGAKAFRTGAWRVLAPSVEERAWAFDLDVLAHAQRLGLRVAEIPVRWRHVARGSKVQAWKDVPQTFWATFRIKRRVRRG